MIDIDKYEGHTPAPWTVDESLMRFAITSANIELVKDAPLLLAFYKRIKEIMDIDEIQEIERVELILQEMIE